MHFISSKKSTTFLVVALIAQAANAAGCFTVKIKQIKRSKGYLICTDEKEDAKNEQKMMVTLLMQ